MNGVTLVPLQTTDVSPSTGGTVNGFATVKKVRENPWEICPWKWPAFPLQLQESGGWTALAITSA